MRYAICNETYRDWSLPEICEDVAAAGYEGLEIAPFTLINPADRMNESVGEQAGRIIRDAGLEAVGFHWLLTATKGLHLTSPDSSVRRATAEFASQLARCCAAMGGRVMVWGSPPQRVYPEDQSREDALACAAEVLHQASEVAGQVGVTIAFEPLLRRETNFINSAAEAEELIDRVGHSACRLHLDVKAMADENSPPAEVIRAHSKHLVHFHANDPNLRGPGMGDVDFDPIFRALQDVNYDDYMSVEVFDYEPDGPTIARESIEYLRRMEQKVKKSGVSE